MLPSGFPKVHFRLPPCSRRQSIAWSWVLGLRGWRNSPGSAHSAPQVARLRWASRPARLRARRPDFQRKLRLFRVESSSRGRRIGESRQGPFRDGAVWATPLEADRSGIDSGQPCRLSFRVERALSGRRAKRWP